MLRKFFTPPVFANEQQTATARILYQVCLIIAGSITVVDFMLFVATPENWLRWLIITLAANSIALLPLWLATRHLRAASLFFALALWGLVTGLAWTAGGLRAPVISGYLIVVFVAGVLLGARAGVGVAGLCMATEIGMAYAAEAGLVPISQVAETPFSLLTRHIAILWIMVGMQYLAADTVNKMLASVRQHERLRELFGRYVGTEVRAAIESGRVSLSGERKTITCLYVDMRGSTTFSEQYPPEQVLAALNDYFHVIILAVEAQGGLVNRFVGDEAVCVFGTPEARPDHAECAVNAALSIRRGLAHLNARRAAQGLPILEFGMGINTGAVVAGATGNAERQEYTVIGDAMNVGARLQGLTKNFEGQDILLSDFTRALLQERYRLADLGEAELRGKSERVRVWGVG